MFGEVVQMLDAQCVNSLLILHLAYDEASHADVDVDLTYLSHHYHLQINPQNLPGMVKEGWMALNQNQKNMTLSNQQTHRKSSISTF